MQQHQQFIKIKAKKQLMQLLTRYLHVSSTEALLNDELLQHLPTLHIAIIFRAVK